MANTSHAMSFRLDNDLVPSVEKWLKKKQPSFSMSQLVNLAIREFVSQDQISEDKETVNANKVQVKHSLKKIMKKHKKTLDELNK